VAVGSELVSSELVHANPVGCACAPRLESVRKRTLCNSRAGYPITATEFFPDGRMKIKHAHEHSREEKTVDDAEGQ